ncbi:putative beta-mannosidase [Bimuria novae-zelandiae CBS 107.79]|uniref:Beta-mannosidase A n=1 Tax=Bimuria novae-zelandiae CBS 107.79 TaxID=1447943 RepID=A0A6A5UZZ5_9PLEO|nr:putative beta-mannosidase [Bimuria novae-zelandiae CBS 107.79]
MFRRSTQAVLGTASLVSVAYSQQVLDLGTVEWTLTSPNFSYISVPGKVPSQVHLDLQAAQVIGDPLYALNEFNLRWIPFSNWTYTSSPLDTLQKNASSTWLVFNGLDTFTSIDFCGQHVAATNNQFRQYYFDVSDILASCNSPGLSVNFGSAPIIANATRAIPGQETWPWGVQQLYEFPNREYIRKEQNDFGWDWGPAFAPAGIWKPAYIVQMPPQNVYVRNTLVDIYREGQHNFFPPDQSKDWVLNASVDYLGSLPSGAAVDYMISDADGSILQSGRLSNATTEDGMITGSTSVPEGAVELWWPVGYGQQQLYNLTLNVIDSWNTTVATVKKRIGFRTIFNNQTPVLQEQLDKGVAPGNNWHFEINGHEFYAKGSNFIPPDPFWPSVTESRLRVLFDSVIDGNQNMLRVWSSGAYSPDFMYDLADEMGILLWSEFEFGCALYPVNEEFLENAAHEVEYQVRRVNHHPSLAYWAGGNELENLELPTVNKTAPEEYPRYLAEYEKLFLDTIAPIVLGNTKSISYSPSSTTNGWLSLDFSKVQPITQRYKNLTEGSIYGNTDFYNYNSSQLGNFSRYPIGRFANEFGFHSMPSLQSWQQVVAPEDLHFNSSVIMLRDHHPPAGSLNASNFYNTSIGQGQMTMAAQEWYPVPNKTDSVANFSAWCHTTQIFQADFYKSQIEFYRRGSALPERQLGSLYWQLEDQWQAPTWAGIEYDGRWKVLHYVAKDIYSPVIISAYRNVTNNDFEIWVISDLWSSISASVNLTWYDWSGKQLNISTDAASNVTVGAINGTQVLSTNLDTLLQGQDTTNTLLRMDVSAQGSLPNSNVTKTFTHTNWFHPAPLSSANLADPGLELSRKDETFTVKATSGVAAFVWLDYPRGVVLSFDDNGFWLAAGEEKKVGYKVKSDSTDRRWRDEVTVRSLWNNTLAEGY